MTLPFDDVPPTVEHDGDTLVVTIPHPPKTKQRPRVTSKGTFTPQQTRDYERAVADAYKAAGGPLHQEQLRVHVELHKTHSVVEFTPLAERYTPLRGDIDNYVKAVLDGLNKVAYADDRQIMEFSAVKVAGTPSKEAARTMRRRKAKVDA